MGKARILKESVRPSTYTQTNQGMTETLRTRSGNTSAFLYIISSKNLGQNKKECGSFHSYANLSSDIDLMNGPADVNRNHEMDDKTGHRVL
jgi:hypothetical protein